MTGRTQASEAASDVEFTLDQRLCLALYTASRAMTARYRVALGQRLCRRDRLLEIHPARNFEEGERWEDLERGLRQAELAATVGIFAFLSSWNDFMMPSLIISQPEWQTIPVVNNIFQTQFSNNYNVSFSSYLMAMAPAIVVYILAQRWVMSGLTQGAIK